jgi:DNA-binding MarR family transcriptional regulator
MVTVKYGKNEKSIRAKTGTILLNENNIYQLWLLIGKIHHKRMLVRQRELSPYHISTRQLRLLSIIRDLGSNATLTAIAKKVDRKVSVLSLQSIKMEKDGLIKRFRDIPKSRLLRIELTEKGLDLIKIDGKSKAMDEIMSVLNAAERRQLHSLLNKILSKLNEYSTK